MTGEGANTRALVALSVLFLVAPLGQARDGSEAGNSSTPLGVTSAGGSASTGLLTIRGQRLLGSEGGAVVVVKLGQQELDVLGATDEEIQAALPAGITPGNYPLQVWAGAGEAWAAEVAVGSEATSPADDGALLKIRQAQADLGSLSLLLQGEEFVSAASPTPTVTLANIPLVVTAASATAIQAQLPGGLTAGGYRVRVLRGPEAAPGGATGSGMVLYTDAFDVAVVAPSSGGDITSVSTPVVGGLQGGTTAGDANLSLRGCSADQVLKSDGSTWSCAADADGGVTTAVNGGGVTGAIAGRTLTLGSTATAANTPGAIVARDAAGNFAAGIIVASLNGNATSATYATNFTGDLSGEVTGRQMTTFVSSALSMNSPGAIVRRDGTGNFAAGTISLAGNLALPTATSASVGVVTMGGVPFLHNFGTNSTFVGYGAGNFTLTGVDNSALGFQALAADTTGYGNSAFGRQALAGDTGGSENSAFGVGTLQANTSNGNSAFGYSALNHNTTGSSNLAFGSLALYANTTGNANSAFGWGALQSLSGGNLNTALGRQAGSGLTSGSYNIYIANIGASTESNTIRIGDTNQIATYVAGIHGQTSASGIAVYVNSLGKLGTTTSSRRYKQEIVDMAAESDVLMRLRPVSFYYRPELDETHTRQYGLVAEEVAELAPELVVRDESGAPETVRYHFVNAMLLNEVQKQRRQLEAQESEIRELRAGQSRLEGLLRQLGAPTPGPSQGYRDEGSNP